MQKLFENWRAYLKEQAELGGSKEKEDREAVLRRFNAARAEFAEEKLKSSNLNKYLKLYPAAKNIKLRKLYRKLVKSSAKLALEKVKNDYINNYQSFRKLVVSTPKFKNEPEESTKEKWKIFNKKLIEKLNKTPVLTFLEDIDRFNENELKIPQALYDTRNKKIYVNPFRIRQTAKEKFKSTLSYAMFEEYIHRAQDILEDLEVPTHQLVWSNAVRQGLILPQKNTNLPKDRYDYFASNPYEFHAKLFQLKSLLKRYNPEIFDEDGGIKPEALKNVLKQKGTEYDVVRVLNPKKINQLATFFDAVAKVDLKKNNQLSSAVA